MNELGKKIINGKIRIVTPVNVGGPQEKHLMRGLDYLVKEGKVYFLDEKKIIGKIGLNEYSFALANNQLSKVLDTKKIHLNEVSYRVVSNISGEVGTDIKINIKDPLTGRPIIPGSSLKGSLRSVIFNYAGGNPHNNEKKVFGSIGEDLFRFITIHDIPFNHTKFINTKTFNLRSQGRNLFGGWKHNLHGQTTDSFNKNGFTFPYEAIDVGDIGDFSITINHKLFEIVNHEQLKVSEFNLNNPNMRLKPNVLRTNSNTKNIFTDNFDLLTQIKKYTKSYLEKEKAFFEQYNTDKTDLIIQEIDKLLKLNEGSPLLRLGLGSGFHAMTGDTLHDNHLIDYVKIYGNRSRGMLNNHESSKSRKFAFTGSDENLKLFPMGFIQLMTDKYYEEYYKAEFESRREIINKVNSENNKFIAEATEKEKAIKAKEIEDELIRAEQERIAREEALKPKITEITTLKKVKWVDAVVVGQKGKLMQFQPFVSGFENKVYEISYASGMQSGTVIQVMCVSPNGKTLQFQGAPKIKSLN